MRKLHLQNQKLSALENKVTELQGNIDVDQYERRGTVVISGPSLPNEATHENPSDLFVNAIKQTLHVNMTHTNVNVGHSLGQTKKGQ